MFPCTIEAMKKISSPVGFWDKRKLLRMAQRELDTQLQKCSVENSREDTVSQIQKVFLEYRNVSLRIEGM